MNLYEELETRVSELDMWISLGQIHKDDVYAMAATIRSVINYAKELADTDYRGNPPVEHYIARKLNDIVKKELNNVQGN